MTKPKSDSHHPKNLHDYTKVIVETDTKNPVIIAEITADSWKLADGYRIRLTPSYAN
ncbi:hypothetical protein QP862_02135 [Lacticaseibacillus rhamnosus]|uniref:hypothetical protein n=1 Tax=Lacticaseibacillus rhamnosus TaxID=47715 RepID=UPI000A8D2FAA|nr:hypothetical protein [Lacticaseibacillus rhamnosus]MDK8384215.1 hypothetical protein [Lacticaseibacillus rhamnosus]MDK8749966.1 hypothetical protein [Lacticaseibacillus rhamnosus]